MATPPASITAPRAQQRSFTARLSGAAWRLVVRLRYHLWLHRRHDRLVLETGLDRPFVVLPGVFNPTLFLTTPFVIEALAASPPAESARVLDMGTGSGALAIAAAASSRQVVAVDANPEAVRCARINVLLNRCDERVEVRQGDLFGPVAGERFDLVLSNPPYYAGEPASQLDRAFYGSDFADRFAAGLGDHLAPAGSALMVLSSRGENSRFVDRLREHGFAVEVEAEKAVPGERLALYRITADA